MSNRTMGETGAVDAWVNPVLGVPLKDVDVNYLFPALAERLQTPLTADDMVAMMDEGGVAQAVLCGGYGTADDMDWVRDAVKAHPERLTGSLVIDPRRGMDALRELERAVKDDGFRMARVIAFETQLPYDHAAYYPIYSKCVELDIPLGVNVGIPGPKVPGKHQHPLALDEVCHFFPELKLIMSHGGDPWAELCVKLMLKWDNLYYMTSAFAPKYLPSPIVDFLNTRGAEKIMWASDYPLLTFERCLREIADLPIRDDRRRQLFLRDNARRVILGQSD